MQNEGIKRVREARQSSDLRQRIWKAAGEVTEAILNTLFLAAVGCLIGIGFGVGMMLFFTWM